MCKIPVYKYPLLLLTICLIPLTQSRIIDIKIVDENNEVFENYPTVQYQIEHPEMSLQMIMTYQFFNIRKNDQDDPFDVITEPGLLEPLEESGLRKMNISFQKYNIHIESDAITFNYGEEQNFEIWNNTPHKNAKCLSEKIDELGLGEYAVTGYSYGSGEEEDDYDFKYITTEDMEAVKASGLTDWNYADFERMVLI